MKDNFVSPHEPKAKLTGATKYINDLNLPGQIVGGILRSPHAHARIVHIDVSQAKQMAGVKAVITAQDVPQLKFGPTKYKDWNILASDRVLFIGDEVAAVAAESKEVLEAALKSIHVEYEILPAVFEPEEALEPSSPIVHTGTERNRPMHLQLERGDVESAMKSAHIIRGGRYVINRIYHGHLEPVAVLANWTDEDGLTLWAGSHIPYRARETYAAAFGLPEDKVRIIVPPIGGSFGAKYVLKMHLIAAALCMQANLPVKIVFNRYEDMITAHPRVPLIIDIKIGADREGRFVFKDAVVYGNAGARIYWSPNIVATACTRADCVYNFNNVRAEGNLCYTNVSPTTCMRGFGNAEMLFAVENVIDELAAGLGMDPAEIRLRNVVRANETTIHGYKLDSCRLDECIERVKAMSGWDRRHKLPKNRGLGMGLANHVSGYRGIDARFDGSTAVLRLKTTGEFVLETGEIELGQGMSQTYAKIIERVLGVDFARVAVKSGDTGRYPFGIGTLASRSTVMGGNATQLAAAQMLQKIVDFAARQFGQPAVVEGGFVRAGGKEYSFEEIALKFRAANAGDELMVRASYIPDTVTPDQTGYGHPSPNYPFAAHVAEVEVDPDTGKIKVVGYWAAHDSGTILNPVAAKGQVVGAVAQGIGWVLMEQLKVQDGRVQNPSLMDYRMPGAADVPQVQVEFIEAPDPNGPFGAKSVGEVALDPVPGAITNAIAHAIGKRGRDLPFTPEKIWRLMQHE